MKIIFSVFVLFFSMLVSAMPLNNIIVFGDSLSDDGNLYKYMGGEFPPSPPYHQGRFSNGLVWIELLAATYFPEDTAAHFQDYAFGGAGVFNDEDVLFSLHHEIDTYFLANQDKADENSLFVVWIGSNNYLNLPDAEENLVDNVVKSISDDLERLVSKGAKHILVANLPDLGHTPAARDMDAVDRLSKYSVDHNQALNSQILMLQERYPQVKWIYYDVFTPFHDMLKDPAAFGFSNVIDTCYESVMSENSSHSVLRMVANIKNNAPKDSCDGFFFFDLVHPSRLAHQILKDRAKDLLEQSGVEFTK